MPKDKVKQSKLDLETLEAEILESKPFKEYNRCLKKTVSFIRPMEEKYTGVGLATLFSFLAARTGAGVIDTCPMGGGKTLKALLVEELMKVSKSADHVIRITEFKKTDWRAMFKQRKYDNVIFHFSIPEISVVKAYSQDFIWTVIPVIQSDGSHQYRWGNEPDEEIVMINCSASYFVASQPPKTHAIINDESFRTLANDRCWNIIFINQMRGRKNIHVRHIPEVVSKIPFVKQRKKKDESIETKEYFRELTDNIKFGGERSEHLTNSDLNFEDFEDAIRNQYSVDRREEQMNKILKEWGSFLNVKTIHQVHLDLFMDLFGFYVRLFNKLTTGKVEMSIDIKYGAVEMLCRISALLARGRIVTQKLLCKEFNAEAQDVEFHLSELLMSGVLQKIDPEKPKRKTRYQRKRVPSGVRKQAKILQDAGIIAKRYATHLDHMKDHSVSPREVVYEFADNITDYFRLYADILASFLTKTELRKIPQIKKFLDGDN